MDDKKFITGIVTIAILGVLFWGAVIAGVVYVLIHFLTKWW